MTGDDTIEEDANVEFTKVVAVAFLWEQMIATVGGITLLGVLLFGTIPGIYAGISSLIAWLASHYFLDGIQQGTVNLESFLDSKISEEEERQKLLSEYHIEEKARKERARKRWNSSWRIWAICTVIVWISCGVLVIYTELLN